MRNTIYGAILLAVFSLMLYSVYGFGKEVYKEWNDIDDYTRVILDKKSGVVEWTTTTGGKQSQTIRHQDGAIWIKAQSKVDGSICTFSERNPFHAEAYEIEKFYDFKNFGGECGKDTSPSSAPLFVLLFMLCIVMFWSTCLIFE